MGRFTSSHPLAVSSATGWRNLWLMTHIHLCSIKKNCSDTLASSSALLTEQPATGTESEMAQTDCLWHMMQTLLKYRGKTNKPL